MIDKRDHDDRKQFIKDAMKEAMKEWLDEKIMSFGKWSLRAIGAAIIVALVYFILTVNGWSHTPGIQNHMNIAP
jgi:hypothetical protein